MEKFGENMKKLRKQIIPGEYRWKTGPETGCFLRFLEKKDRVESAGKTGFSRDSGAGIPELAGKTSGGNPFG